MTRMTHRVLWFLPLHDDGDDDDSASVPRMMEREQWCCPWDFLAVVLECPLVNFVPSLKVGTEDEPSRLLDNVDQETWYYQAWNRDAQSNPPPPSFCGPYNRWFAEVKWTWTVRFYCRV